MTAEAERGGGGDVDIPFDTLVRYVIQVAFGIRSFVVDGGGVERVANRKCRDDGFAHTGGAHAVACHALGAGHLDLVGVFAEGDLEHRSFGRIVQVCRGSVCVVVVNVGRGNASVLDGAGKSLRAGFSTRARARDVISVGRSTVAGEFGVNLGAAGLGVFQFFENQHCTAFTHHESRAVQVERARCLFRAIVKLVCKGVHAGEALDAVIGNAAFGTTGKADIQATRADGVEGDTDSVGTRGTGGADRVGLACNAEGDRDVCASFVRN